jgi:hypothetical protein
LESPPAARETLKVEKLRPKVTARPTMRPRRIGSPRRPCSLFHITSYYIISYLLLYRMRPAMMPTRRAGRLAAQALFIMLYSIALNSIISY